MCRQLLIYPVLLRAQEELLAILDGTTLHDLADGMVKLSG
jgi:hypothetical protein